MDFDRIKLLANTLKYLRFKQVYYRVYYLIRNRFFPKSYEATLKNNFEPLEWKNFILHSDSFHGNLEFEFLNLKHRFEADIDWDFSDFGKLWTYNLNYFDFLNQRRISADGGLGLIRQFIEKKEGLKDALEPYPISLRCINWVKFLSQNKISDHLIDQALYNDYYRLLHNLEYHLLGNHLLENGFSLFFGAYYFQSDVFYRKGQEILREQLGEQILKDGAHFELSPMYHQIMLYRLLDCIQLARFNPWKEDGLHDFLVEKATCMLSWLNAITYSNGNIPWVNDSAMGIAPTSRELFDFANQLNLSWEYAQLSDSGYRTFKFGHYELFVDVGNIGPDYQPGHAHADTFSFELYNNGRPLIVDTGISTYEKNKLRSKERSTESHNTVMVANLDQSQVWGGFRVASRAYAAALQEGDSFVEATHDGYKDFGIWHTRRFEAEEKQIKISDTLTKGKADIYTAFLHFDPDVELLEIDANSRDVVLPKHGLYISFEGDVRAINQKTYEYANGFNLRLEAIKLEIQFFGNLTTCIGFTGLPNNQIDLNEDFISNG